MKINLLRCSFFLILSFTATISCSDSDDTLNTVCGTTDPIEELDWLRSEIAIRRRDVSEDAKYQYISSAEFEGQTVFLYRSCDPKANVIVPVHDCEGQNLGEIGNEFVLDDFTNIQLLFKPLNFACE
ncbi:hypothetical protein ACEZ3G_14480 [Maribacter algicola]|uniref:Uncharacterized protein n=1 Tax=Meishania litoralis TaxID=3434685 RepID=A0ACC7LSZ9_9FLAO